jgi:hypothetical protein
MQYWLTSNVCYWYLYLPFSILFCDHIMWNLFSLSDLKIIIIFIADKMGLYSSIEAILAKQTWVILFILIILIFCNPLKILDFCDSGKFYFMIKLFFFSIEMNWFDLLLIGDGAIIPLTEIHYNECITKGWLIE